MLLFEKTYLRLGSIISGIDEFILISKATKEFCGNLESIEEYGYILVMKFEGLDDPIEFRAQVKGAELLIECIVLEGLDREEVKQLFGLVCELYDLSLKGNYSRDGSVIRYRFRTELIIGRELEEIELMELLRKVCTDVYNTKISLLKHLSGEKQLRPEGMKVLRQRCYANDYQKNIEKELEHSLFL